ADERHEQHQQLLLALFELTPSFLQVHGVPYFWAFFFSPASPGQLTVASSTYFSRSLFTTWVILGMLAPAMQRRSSEALGVGCASSVLLIIRRRVSFPPRTSP